jgi:hypothetical protein
VQRTLILKLQGFSKQNLRARIRCKTVYVHEDVKRG